ncbi:MAG: diphthine--ammonia ligase [Candidatus Woesearchaeota archaeon]
MKVGVLFSGGKDSTYATYLATKEHEVVCLISIFSKNKESYMFHTANIELVKQQAKLMNIPIIIKKTQGKKELELKDLENIIKEAIKKYKIQGIVTGAVASVYQSSRVQDICNKLNIKCINFLWQKNPEEYWNALLKNQFEIIITNVSAEGLNEEWLGKKIDYNSLEKLKNLSKKFNFHIAFEGGEAETFVINCPLFNKKIEIIKAEKKFKGNNGIYKIEKIKLTSKSF